jgi:hypothetical protein
MILILSQPVFPAPIAEKQRVPVYRPDQGSNQHLLHMRPEHSNSIAIPADMHSGKIIFEADTKTVRNLGHTYHYTTDTDPMQMCLFYDTIIL